jgi:hypothetical protein
MGGNGGGAFGPTQFGMPSTPTAATYNNNPSSYTAFNQTPLMNQATASTNAEVGNQQRQEQGQANAAGAGRSSGNNAAQRDISAQGQNVVANQNLNAAQNSFNQQLEQQNAQNNWGLQEQNLAQDQYKTSAGLTLGEQANRQQQIAQLPGGQYINMFGGNY